MGAVDGILGESKTRGGSKMKVRGKAVFAFSLDFPDLISISSVDWDKSETHRIGAKDDKR